MAVVAGESCETVTVRLDVARRMLLGSAPLSLRLARQVAERTTLVAHAAATATPPATESGLAPGQIPFVEVGAFDITAQVLRQGGRLFSDDYTWSIVDWKNEWFIRWTINMLTTFYYLLFC